RIGYFVGSRAAGGPGIKVSARNTGSEINAGMIVSFRQGQASFEEKRSIVRAERPYREIERDHRREHRQFGGARMKRGAAQRRGGQPATVVIFTRAIRWRIITV